MKKIKILLLFLLFVSTSLFSQTHMTFKNIPISGKTNLFAQELIKTGYKLIEYGDNTASLSGNFVNEDCEIYVIGSKKSNTTWKVTAYLPKETNWYRIKSKYFELKEQYQKKYGEGISYEFFKTPYYEGDGYEMQALYLEKCIYSTFFYTDFGIISITITEFQQIAIAYEDATNLKIKQYEDQAIISKDI